MATTSIAEAREAHATLTTKLNQLEALLLMTLDEGRRAFGMMSPASQVDYMGCCTDLVQECRELTKAVAPAMIEGGV